MNRIQDLIDWCRREASNHDPHGEHLLLKNADTLEKLLPLYEAVKEYKEAFDSEGIDDMDCFAEIMAREKVFDVFDEMQK